MTPGARAVKWWRVEGGQNHHLQYLIWRMSLRSWLTVSGLGRLWVCRRTQKSSPTTCNTTVVVPQILFMVGERGSMTRSTCFPTWLRRFRMWGIGYTDGQLTRQTSKLARKSELGICIYAFKYVQKFTFEMACQSNKSGLWEIEGPRARYRWRIRSGGR